MPKGSGYPLVRISSSLGLNYWLDLQIVGEVSMLQPRRSLTILEEQRYSTHQDILTVFGGEPDALKKMANAFVKGPIVLIKND